MVEMKSVSVGTEEAIAFAELGMHLRDLEEAVDSIETALAFPPPRSLREGRLRSHLLSSGVIAYWRCFTNNDSARILDSSIAIPESLRPAHEVSRKWRNQVVAHNDSAMKRSLAFIALTKTEEGIEVGVASNLSIEIAVPDFEAEALLNLVTAILEAVQEEMQLRAERMLRQLGAIELDALWNRADNEAEISDSTLGWDPGRKRLSSFVRVSYPIESTTELSAHVWIAGRSSNQ